MFCSVSPLIRTTDMFTHGTAFYFLFEFGELKLVIVYYLLDMYSMVQRLFQTDSTFELGIVSQSHSPGLCYMLLLFEQNLRCHETTGTHIKIFLSIEQNLVRKDCSNHVHAHTSI